MRQHKPWIRALLSACLYLTCSAAILGWWALALRTSPAPVLNKIPQNQVAPIALMHQLSPLDRNTLKKALGGDYALMTKLIADWEVDARLLSQAGIENVRALSSTQFLQSQLLGRELAHKVMTDAKIKVLPQTYVAASFLLALTSPDHIIALPTGLRRQEQLYPLSLTSRIPLDVDRHNAEKLYEARPDLAIVSAYYSHPGAIQVLQNQGIDVLATDALGNLEEIKTSLLHIGKAVGKAKEAELMALFIDAALIAIDNRLAANDLCQNSLTVLYVNYHDQYYLPAPNTVCCELLQRLGIANPRASRGYEPIDREQIRNINPDCLIVSSMHGAALKERIENDPALVKTRALQEHRVHVVDDEVQQTPTQYVVLAYFDIAQALAGPYLR